MQTEYLEHEKNSLLVPPADAEALAKEISELANNAEKRKLLGENALKDFTNKLNYNCFLKEIKKAYGY